MHAIDINDFLLKIQVLSQYDGLHLVSLTLDKYSIATACVSPTGLIVFCTIRQRGTRILYRIGNDYEGLMLEMYNKYKDLGVYKPWSKQSPYYELLNNLKKVYE